ncbi:efflux RND transporter periplasmic adaptor subunit [Echinicola shivajiensis]|uniref:efflux RND transporter periplasmic adaptor subunit n=1 Tax=Echinicola shivajiensis TaxID=1035916 RepID=UPI001FE415FD|nr:efflux RND transporter periplasmic adaptor subunit [Echinicola shivajiensis]
MMKIKMKYSFFFYTALLGCLLVYACDSKDQEVMDSNKEEMASQGNIIRLSSEQYSSGSFETGEMEQVDFHEAVNVNGMLDVPPENKVAISAYFGGYIKELSLLPGQKVNKGQVLLVLENPDYLEIQQDFLEAKGQIKYLEADYKRQAELSKENVSSEKKYLKAEADYKVMKARYESLQKKLLLMGINTSTLDEENISSRITLRAPISGYIAEITAEKGMFLNPSDIAFTITNTDHIHLELNVFEKDVLKVKVGQKVVFSLQDNPAEKYNGEVHLVGRTIGEGDRSIRVHVHIEGEDELENLVPGMFAEAKILLDSSQSPALPETGVVKVDQDYYVLLKNGNDPNEHSFMKKLVKVGERDGNYVEIINANDFNTGSQFLTKGAYNLIKE